MENSQVKLIIMKEIQKNSLRQEMELAATSTNKYLKDVVYNMDNIALLRNMHPYLSSYFADRLYMEHLINLDQAGEFNRKIFR